MTLNTTLKQIALSPDDIRRMEQRDWFKAKGASEVLDEQFSDVFEEEDDYADQVRGEPR